MKKVLLVVAMLFLAAGGGAGFAIWRQQSTKQHFHDFATQVNFDFSGALQPSELTTPDKSAKYI